MFNKVTHVIFDMDGLLLDSEPMYDKIIGEIAQKYGKEYTLDVRLKVLGTPEPVTAQLAVSEMELPITPEQFVEQCIELGNTYLQNIPLCDGAERLVKHLHNHNVPIAIATSSTKQAMEIKTKNHKDLFSLFHHIVLGASDPEVKRGKPHPDIYLICASRFPDNPSPENCLVLEDAPNGVIGARSAGMQVVMVPTDEVGEELRKPATLVLNTLTDFKPDLFGLPAFKE